MDGPPSGPLPLRVSMTRHGGTVSNWSAGRVSGRVTCPILLPLFSVNHSAPSDPPVTKKGLLNAVGIVYSEMAPAVVIRPILLPVLSVNHSAPSGPALMPSGALNAVGIVYSEIAPAVVIRPILSLSCSVNHSAPSGPALIPRG